MEYSFILQKRLSVMKTLVKNSMHGEQRKICTAVLFLLNKYTTQPQSHKSQQFCCSIIVSSKQWLSYISVNLALNSYIPLPQIKTSTPHQKQNIYLMVQDIKCIILQCTSRLRKSLILKQVTRVCYYNRNKINKFSQR